MNVQIPNKNVNKGPTCLGIEKYLSQLLKPKPSSKQDEIALKAKIGSVAHNFCKLKQGKFLK